MQDAAADANLTWKEQYPSCELPPLEQQLSEPKIGLPAFATETSAADLVVRCQTVPLKLPDEHTCAQTLAASRRVSGDSEHAAIYPT